jgi:hypothetical protein
MEHFASLTSSRGITMHFAGLCGLQTLFVGIGAVAKVIRVICTLQNRQYEESMLNTKY